MKPKVKVKNKESILNFFKPKTVQVREGNQPVAKPCDKLATSTGCTTPLTQRQLGLAPTLHHHVDKQGEEPHETHTFEWWGSDKRLTTITCNKAGTVEDILRRSAQFREIAEKNKTKELVIVRDGKAVSSHFPCSLIKNERLTVKYVKARDNKLKKLVENHGVVDAQRKRPSNKLVTFHVLTVGGKKVVKIMRNPAAAIKEEITVYAYKGEKVKHALKRDGRLLVTIFKKNCALLNTSTEVTTEMSSLVDDLDGKTFKIILLNKSSPPESQPGSLDDAYVMQNESQVSDSDGGQEPPQQSTTTESGKANTPEETPKLKSNEPEKILCKIPNSKKMQGHLSSQFKDLVKGMTTQQGPKFSRIQNLFRVQYGKNAQMCREVKTMKKLMDLSNSVCQVRINGRPSGTGFLLFDNFVLTNGHVVENIYNESTGKLDESVTVHFSFEGLDQMESGAKVDEVVGFEHCLDESRQEYDWALLRLSADLTLPDVLLTHFGFLPQSGGICIIGHPDGGVKRIDPCLITPTHNRSLVVERHCRENPDGVLVEGIDYGVNQGIIQLVTDSFFDSVAESVKEKKQVLTYESCFYFGSSGSPVFDEHCNVVAMHSGGYAYRSARGESQSVIEFGYPLSVIIEHIIVQMVKRGRFDVLKKYLSCSYARHQHLMTSLKKLIESRNLTAFKNAVNNQVVTSDESLKTFFEFLSQKEEPVPMDMDTD